MVATGTHTVCADYSSYVYMHTPHACSYISRDGLDVAQDIVDVARVWVMFLLSLGCRLPCYALRISLNEYVAIYIYI